MAAELRIQLDQEFAKQLRDFAGRLRRWDGDTSARIEKAMWVIATRWQAECKKRVPIDNGTLHQRILMEVFREAGNWVAAVGSNLPYAKFLEFGTRFIAGGRVMALGDGTDITDDQAIKIWPALLADGGTGEQMPWLRPSLMSIKPWAMELLLQAMLPPSA